MRYVRFERIGFIFSPEGFGQIMTHADVARAIGDKVVSAGFVHADQDGLTCYGGSASLGIESLPEDTLLVRQLL